MTNTVNRKKAPPLELIKGLSLPKPDKLILANGIPVYSIGGLPQDAVKIELVFKAGKWFQSKKLVAKAVANVVKEGTQKYTALQIAQELDYYGASFRGFAGTDIATFTLFSLNKYLDKVLPVLEDLIKRPLFPENDLNIFLNNSKEHLKVDLMKNDFVADRKFSEALYGADHPYGYYAHVEDYDQVSREDLVAFHKKYFHSGNCSIIVSGKVDTSTLKWLENHFGGTDWEGSQASDSEHAIESMAQLKSRYPVSGSVQSAIRIGKRLFNKAHPDHHQFNILNTLLGGYFGSRLMSNIREEKGYTYGIHSGLNSMLHDGYFTIATEVGIDVCEDAVKQIYLEIERLQQEPIPAEELDLVRNYLTGRIQSSLDGPFKVSTLFKGLVIYNLDIDYIYNLIDTINTVSARDLQDLAIKHLDVSGMHEIIVG